MGRSDGRAVVPRCVVLKKRIKRQQGLSGYGEGNLLKTQTSGSSRYQWKSGSVLFLVEFLGCANAGSTAARKKHGKKQTKEGPQRPSQLSCSALAPLSRTQASFPTDSRDSRQVPAGA